MLVRWVISWCLRNPVLVCLGAAAILIAGFLALERTPVDAIPDIGEKQVIVFADWEGRSPQDVDDQVTYPLTASLEGTPGVKTIRSMSGFGFSMVFAIFSDDVDYYWARSRVLERLSAAAGRLPEGVTPVLGPDATALGQIFWYTIEGEGFSLDELRSVQDWYVRYQLNAVEGVSEVASIGGHVREYQIDLDADRMRAHRVNVPEVFEAVRRSNLDVGAKVIESNRFEYFIRGVGFVKTVEDLENVVLRQEGGTPLYVKNVATVTLGPEFRRGALNKEGVEAAGGIVLSRYGANPREVIGALKKRIAELEPGLPQRVLADGTTSKVRLVPYYDRSVIIDETVATLKEALTEELIVAAGVVLIFLLHLRASASIVVTLPLSMAMAYMAMYWLGVDANIMSVAGLAIAIGDVADMGIIMTENIVRHLAADPAGRKTRDGHLSIVERAAHEVGPAITTAVLNTILSFIPVFLLAGQEGKLFKPLAYTKTFAISASVILALTVVPAIALLTLREGNMRQRSRWILSGAIGAAATIALRLILVRFAGFGSELGWPMCAALGVIIALLVFRMTGERVAPAEKNPVSRAIFAVYAPSLRWVLHHKALFLTLPSFLLVLGLSIWLGFSAAFRPVSWPLEKIGLQPQSWAPWSALAHVFPGLGREFMPSLDEGSFLYMPSILPAGSLTQGLEVIGGQNARMRTVPEVLDIVGKIGRSESALDPAPISMVETIITLKPESEWRDKPVQRWFADWPAFARGPLAYFWPETRKITKEELLLELQDQASVPGVLPTWLQPIQTRLVMLSSGFRAMMGVKIYGPDLHEIELIGVEMERALRQVSGAVDVVADRIIGKPYLEFVIDREAAARYGVRVEDVQEIVEMAIGGERATTTVEGAERYPVRVRFARELRDSAEALEKVLVPTSAGAQVPLASVANFRMVIGPQEIKREDTLKVGYVTLNTRDRDEVSVVEDAEKLLRAKIADGSLVLPAGYYYRWGGQFEAQVRSTARLQLLVPLVFALMFLLIYLGFGRWWIALVVLAGISVSVTGGFLMLWLWGVNLSVAVWVGMIALLGVADDDSVVMLTYLEQLFGERKPKDVAEIRELVVEAGLKRIRPCLMTTATTVVGLIPVFTTHGRGSDVMQPMAIPSVGGMAIQLITLFVAPCLYCLVMERKFMRARKAVAS
jgi:Cu(I)/Ag(I) efflux system membrane protein CusA/SilA